MEKKYTVLYIEDNQDNRVLVERFLEFEGFTVYSAENGQMGLDKASELLPDVLLIDLNLPDISGYEVVDILNDRLETRDIPKIVFSASDIKQEQIPGVDFNYSFIQKPIDVNTLAERIKSAIQHSPDNPGPEH
jgi:two-component system phosphate regulon response regulator PhoB